MHAQYWQNTEEAMDDYYTKPDHGHNKADEYPDWVAYVILVVAFVVTFGTIILLGCMLPHPFG